MTPTTPSGCGMSRLRAPAKVRRSTFRRCGRIHPFSRFDGVVNRVERQEDFGEQRLEFAAVAVVRVDRGDDRGLVFLDQAAERLEVGDPLGIGGLGRLEIGGALGGEAGLEFGRDREFRTGKRARSWTFPRSCGSPAQAALA